jgi:hypothetical protein
MQFELGIKGQAHHLLLNFSSNYKSHLTSNESCQNITTMVYESIIVFFQLLSHGMQVLQNLLECL